MSRTPESSRSADRQVDTELEIPALTGPNIADVGSCNVHDTVSLNAAATTARSGGESSRHLPQHFNQTIPAEPAGASPKGELAATELSSPAPLDRCRDHVERHEHCRRLGQRAREHNRSCVNVRLKQWCALGSHATPADAATEKPRTPICSRHFSAPDAQANPLSDQAMGSSYAASVDSNGQFQTFANTFSKTLKQGGARDKYSESERICSHNYSRRTEPPEQQKMRAADMSTAAAMTNQQRAVATLTSNRPASPNRLASTSSFGTTTVNDQIQQVRCTSRSTFLMSLSSKIISLATCLV